MHFASDTTAPVHPGVMQALAQANEGYAPSYGTDALTDEVRDRIRNLFEAPEAAVYLVATGSTANALALATLCPPWGAIFCHRLAHIETDECGAPEFYTGGAKLRLVDGSHAKMTPERLRAAIEDTRTDVHSVQRGAVSITNVTERGTIYTAAELSELTAIARDYGLPVHMDGARFANALAATGATPAEMTWKTGIDVLSFGGTKNGLMGVEAAVIFDPEKAWEFELRRKRGAHLFSKHRFLAAQMAAYLADDLWLEMARAANAATARLVRGLKQVPEVSLPYEPRANIVFAEWPRAVHRRLQEAGAQYHIWNGGLDGPGDERLIARLVTDWSATEADVDRFLDLLGG